MNEVTLEWVLKADGDFVAATELLNLRVGTLADVVCFHCQQCAEKYTKAYLHHLGVEFPRTHHLLELLSLCEQSDSTFRVIFAEMQSLNSYSVEVRYPGRFTSLEEAEGAVDAMNTVRNLIRLKIGLDTETTETEDREL